MFLTWPIFKGKNMKILNGGRKYYLLAIFTWATAGLLSAAPGIINTVAGNGTQSYGGDGGSALLAELNHPYSVATDSFNNIYICDFSNNRVRKVTVSTGVITTVAGTGVAGYNGDGIPATSAEINNPIGIYLDSNN